MHTVLVIGGGILLLGVCLAIAKIIRASPPTIAFATKAFTLVWFLLAALNLWIGVARAGNPVGKEFPIFLLVFAAPATIAYLVRSRYGAK